MTCAINFKYDDFLLLFILHYNLGALEMYSGSLGGSLVITISRLKNIGLLEYCNTIHHTDLEKRGGCGVVAHERYETTCHNKSDS